MAKNKRMYKKPKTNGVRKRRAPVPGWGGAIGRVARVGMKYVTKGGMAYKALRLARKVADAVNIEYKHFDTESLGGAIDFTGGVAILNAMAQGASDQTRIGDSIKVQNNNIRFVMARNGQDAQVRVIIYWDDQNQITTLANLLQVSGTAASTLSPKNYDLRFRSKILHDQTYNITSNFSLVKDEVLLNIDAHTQFSAATTTINTGALKIAIVSNVSGVNLPTISYYNRCTYTDD